MTTLEKIRAEIDEYLIAEGFGTEYRADITRIIDKYAEQEPCDDVVSREMALKECHGIVIDGERYRVIQEETLLGLPPVRPQEPKTGHWINKEFRKEEYVLIGKCSVCGRGRVIDGFCSYCGCRMVDPQESE